MRSRIALLAVCAALACRKAPPAARDGAATASLIFAASTAGQLVPCGCSPDQRGGLPRAVSLAKKLRAATPGLLYVDAGDLLFD
ncbi:MAG TPA: cytochrome C, partial [Thermoanaerobaculia bacterium]